MATRSVTELKDDKGNSIRYYHHYDGYPKGVGKILLGNLAIVISAAKAGGVSKFEKFKELLDEDEAFEEGDFSNEEYTYYVELSDEVDTIYYDKYGYIGSQFCIEEEHVKLY